MLGLRSRHAWSVICDRGLIGSFPSYREYQVCSWLIILINMNICCYGCYRTPPYNIWWFTRHRFFKFPLGSCTQRNLNQYFSDKVLILKVLKVVHITCVGWPHDKPEAAAIRSNVSELKAHPDGNYNPDKYDTRQQQIILPTYYVFIINMLKHVLMH